MPSSLMKTIISTIFDNQQFAFESKQSIKSPTRRCSTQSDISNRSNDGILQGGAIDCFFSSESEDFIEGRDFFGIEFCPKINFCRCRAASQISVYPYPHGGSMIKQFAYPVLTDEKI